MLSLPTSKDALAGQVQRDQPVDPELALHYRALQKAMAAGDGEAVQFIQGRIQEATSRLRTQEATRGMGEGDKFLSGIGSGMDRVGRGAADIATLGTRADDPQGDEDRKLATEQLKATDMGSAGDFVGEQAALLPVGVGVGALVDKAGAKAGALGLKAASKLLSSVPVRAALEGGAMGAVSAQPGERGEGAAAGALAGYGFSKAGQALRRTYKGIVQPTRAAQALRREGVDLTVGQMAPSSAIGQFEEAGQSAGGIGPSLRAQRELGRESWQDAVMKKTAPPGGAVPPRSPTNSVPDRLAATYKQFEEPYQNAVKGETVYPAAHRQPANLSTPLQRTAGGKPGAFDLALMDPLVDDATKLRVKNFLDNQLSMLPGGATHPGVLQKVPAETLQKIRSNIRAAVRQRASSGDIDGAALLSNAEKQVTAALETQLSPAKGALLKATDRQYARYKTVEGASARAADSPGSFTPAQLGAEVKSNMDKGFYGRGGGGDLRRLAANGRAVLDTKSPPTGARYLTVGGPFSPTPWLAAAANARPVKSFLMGETKPQKAAQMLELALRRSVGSKGRQKAADIAALTAALLGSHSTGED